jgi:hypothetical protein
MPMIAFGLFSGVALAMLIQGSATFWLGVSVVWGVVFGISARSGVESAPAVNWRRQPTKRQSMAVLTLLCAILFLPAAYAALSAGFVTALCSGWLIFAAMGVTFLMGDWVHGPLLLKARKSSTKP